jgi:hypothetical protein
MQFWEGLGKDTKGQACCFAKPIVYGFDLFIDTIEGLKWTLLQQKNIFHCIASHNKSLANV